MDMKLQVVLLSFIVFVSVFGSNLADTAFEKINVASNTNTFFKNTSSRIVDGFDSFTRWVPFQAGLLTNTGVMCGGALIQANMVLTAARCLSGMSSVDIWLGSPAWRNGTKIAVSKNNFFIHPEFVSPLNGSDIALILLPGPVKLGPTIRTIDLPSEEDADKDFADQYSIVSGWGKTYSGSTQGSSTLQYKVLRTLSNKGCQNNYEGILDILNSFICVMPSACNGDEGGPLVTFSGSKLTLIGVESFVFSEICEKAPAIYTRLSSHLPWIKLYAELAKSYL